MKQGLSNFDSNPLNCDPTLFLGKNSPNIAKRYRIFPGKRGGDKALVLKYLDSPMLKFFGSTGYSFPFRPSSGRKGGSKLDQKCSTIGASFKKTRILQKIFKQWFCLLEYYLWWEFWKYWTIFFWGGWVGARGQKPFKKGHFMYAESVRNTLKIFSLSTANLLQLCIFMKM